MSFSCEAEAAVVGRITRRASTDESSTNRETRERYSDREIPLRSDRGAGP
jgi:hypothetical protein